MIENLIVFWYRIRRFINKISFGLIFNISIKEYFILKFGYKVGLIKYKEFAEKLAKPVRYFRNLNWCRSMFKVERV